MDHRSSFQRNHITRNQKIGHRLLKLRLAVLRTAGGIFIRSIMAFENPSGDIAFPWALLEAASTGTDSEREDLAHRIFQDEDDVDARSPSVFDCDLDAASYQLKTFAVVEEKFHEAWPGLKHTANIMEDQSRTVESRHARRRAYRDYRNQVRGMSHQFAHYLIKESCRIHKRDLERFGLVGRRGQEKARRLCPSVYTKATSLRTYLARRRASGRKRKHTPGGG